LERGKIDEDRTFQIVHQIAAALQYVFENGLVHRNIKPDNIMIANDGTVKLLDVGVSMEVAYPSSLDFMKSNVAYASPEQVRDDLDIDIRSDLYSLGCIWYQMLIGQQPYRGLTTEQIMHKHLEEDIPNPREDNIRISAATSELIRSLLQKDRDDRPRVPQDFINRLVKHPLYNCAEEEKKEAIPECETCLDGLDTENSEEVSDEADDSANEGEE
ncbi:MAG: serine/threonine protein kinase, partial [Planctomycetes bacterium]|nr:serine/threonine protein kinase [Planctomycetota bacterium]